MAENSLRYEIVHGLAMYRKYTGLSKDFDKIPRGLTTGSSFYAIDTHNFYKYEESTDSWYLQPSTGSGGGNDEDIKQAIIDYCTQNPEIVVEMIEASPHGFLTDE